MQLKAIFDVRVAILIACIAHLFSILLFMRGFFPMKTVSSGYSTFLLQEATGLSTMTAQNKELLTPIVGRVVLMVIDALREDFVFDEKHMRNMPYVHDLLRQNKAVSFVARVHPPTVTMPRIKAMTTGTIPGFVDILLNLGSPELAEDNVISQARRNGHTIVFYGDDTWLRMFPTAFLRREGTTSFYVSDFTEVDNNVTRHVGTELENHDWSILILHYLGLDHIGHVAGPHSGLIGPKLKEMDDVIRQIHVGLISDNRNNLKPPLVVICGDHGIGDSGGHGGATYHETRVPLVFVSPAFEGKQVNKEVLQIDVASTLSVLLGLPIPKNNLGRVLLPLLSGLKWRKRLYLAQVNAAQLQNVAWDYLPGSCGDCLSELKDAKQEHSEWLKGGMDRSNLNPESVLAKYRNASVCFSDVVSSRLIKYDVYVMVVAIVIQSLSLCFAVAVMTSSTLLRLIDIRQISPSAPNTFLALFAVLLVLHGFFCWTEFYGDCILCELSFGSTVAVIISAILIAIFVSLFGHLLTVRTVFWQLAKRVSHQGVRTASLFFATGSVCHTLSFAASSFIEEEQQTWYFLCTTMLVVGLVTNRNDTVAGPGGGGHRNYHKMMAFFAAAVVFRIARSWNRTGDKWAHLDDTGDWLNRPENKMWLSAAVSVGLLASIVLRIHRQRWPVTVILTVSCLVTYLYHCATGLVAIPLVDFPGVSQSNAMSLARLNYLVVFLIPVVAFVVPKNAAELLEPIITGWLALAVLLLRPHNIALVPFWLAMRELYSGILAMSEIPSEVATVAFTWMAQASFFQQGNSNSLAKVDLASGYVGLRTYNPILVAPLLLCATFAGPIFWILSLISVVSSANPQSYHKHIPRCLLVLVIQRILPWSFYTFVVYIQRYHLFVWTVFSPKLLFEGTLSVVYIFVVFIFLIIITRLNSNKRSLI